MKDLHFLERTYEELHTYLSGVGAAGARLLAISSFIKGIPEDLRGRKYYLEELAPLFAAAQKSLDGNLRDPEFGDIACAAHDELKGAGLLPADSVGPDVQSVEIRSHVPNQLTARITVSLPLIRELPPFLAFNNPLSSIGTMAEITISPHSARWKAPRIRWNNGNVEKPVGELRSLDDVAADSLLAASEALRCFLGFRVKQESRSSSPRSDSHDLIQGLARTHGAAADPGSARGYNLSLPEKVIPIVGDSAGLGLAAGFLGAMVGGLMGGRLLRPTIDTAWTGCIDPSGAVKSVDFGTLRAKARAAFFSGYSRLVVPDGQGNVVRELVDRDGLEIDIVEVGHLYEVLRHPELFEVWHFPRNLVRSLKFRPVWKAFRRFAAVTAVLGMIYFLPWIAELAGVKMYTYWHPKPDFKNAHVELLNDLHTIRLTVPGLRKPIIIAESAQVVFHDVVSNLAGGIPGRAYIVYGISWGPRDASPGAITVFDIEEEVNLWSYQMEEAGLPKELWAGQSGGTISVKGGHVGDFDGDGETEILAAGSFQPWSQSFVWLFGDEGRPTGVVFHSGHIERYSVADIDGDGDKEIFLLGLHNFSKGLSMIALEREQFHPFMDGEAAGTETAPMKWNLDSQPCIFNIVVPVIPGLADAEGRETLGLDGAPAFTRSADGEYLALLYVNVSKRPDNTCDYIINVNMNGEVVDVIPNAPMVERARFWIEQGKTDIDFVSGEVMERWQETMRTARTIQLSYAPPIEESR